MKKVSILLTLLFLVSTNIWAQKNNQVNEKVASPSSVSLENLIKQKSLSYVITKEHVSSLSGIRHVYLRQAINGLEVCGTESSVHIDQSGKTVVSHNNFLQDIQATVKSASQNLSADQAIAVVAGQMGYSLANLQQVKSEGGINKKAQYNKAGISSEEIPVKLMYYYRKGLGTVLVWELSVAELTSSDWWNFRVDAATGKIIDKDNWTHECFDLGEHNHVSSEIASEKKYSEFVGPVNKTTRVDATDGIGTYNVYAMPVESPLFGARSLVVGPENLTASPYRWHDTNGAIGAEFTNTRGNNVSAWDDGDGNDAPDGAYTASPGGNLVFDFPLNTTYSASDQSTNAATTNLFYWNNIIHDVMYQYGFDEASGNFQENNYGKGGLGSDSVNALAQSGKGTCNANFGTPADGSKPRMRMYVCDDEDGDLDNWLIIHEYGHGIHSRLNTTGGAERMNEGWGDYYGLMLTMQAGVASTVARGFGNFAFNSLYGANGARTYPYSTDFAVNPHTYNDINTEVAPHGVGSVWAMMLWEMTWELIAIHGFDTDFYNGTGGNNISLALVTEGLKLQPPNAGFVDGRDAILLADQNLYGGANSCAIWTAFAKRGLGTNASQGLSSSKSDGVESFDLVSFVPSKTTICITEGVVSGIGGGLLSGGTYSDASGVIVVDGGDGLTFSFDPVVAGIGDHIVTYTESCSGLMTTASATITVTSGIPDLVCKDFTVALDHTGSASIEAKDVVANLIESGTLGYTSDQTGTFAPESISAAGTTVALGDDAGTGPLPLGFTFKYFGTSYTDIYIASNGYVSLTGTGMTQFLPTSLPSGDEPNGMIAVAWADWSPNIGGTIRYEVTGTAPNRKMVVEYNEVPHFGDSETTLTAQLQLYEGSNRIEIHTTNATDNGGLRTQGIENIAGDMAVVTPGRNLAVWGLTNDYAAFVPIPGGLPDNCDNPVTISLSQSDFTCDDKGNVSVTVTADDGFGGISSCNTTVTIVDPLSTCNEPPVAVCKNLTVSADANCENNSITASDFNGGSTDPDGDTLTYSVSPTRLYPLGTTNVVLFVSDGEFTDTCTATVTVVDDTPPTITCPDDIVISSTQGQCNTIVDLGTPTFSDNCPGATESNNAPDDYPFGTTEVVWMVTDAAGNTAQCIQTVTIDKINTITTVTVDPTSQQYSDLVDFEATIQPGNCPGVGLAATSVSFYVRNQLMGTVGLVLDSGNLVGSLTESLVEIPSPPATGDMAPGTALVTAVFNGINPNYDVVDATTNLTITQEDAIVDYTGHTLQATPSANASLATVVLSANIQDITISDPDPNPGDIRNALVKFVDRDGGDISGWIPVTDLFDPSDPTTGTVSFDWLVDIGGDSSKSYTVGVIVGGYYFRDDSSDNTVVTVYKPKGDFITGGGYIFPDESAGVYASTDGLKTNFGFNVKYNKKGKKLRGHMNIIFRRDEGGVIHTYQIKGNAIQSLGVDVADPDNLFAEFITKANLRDITDPLNPISLGGNHKLKVEMTDRGEPGNFDSIGINLKNSSNVLLYSSNWIGISTEEMVLSGGNLVVHSGFSTGTAADIYVDDSIIDTEGLFDVMMDNNPFTNTVTLTLKSDDDTRRVQYAVYDINNKLLLYQELAPSEQFTFGKELGSGMYLVSVTQGSNKKIKRLIKR